MSSCRECALKGFLIQEGGTGLVSPSVFLYNDKNKNGMNLDENSENSEVEASEAAEPTPDPSSVDASILGWRRAFAPIVSSNEIQNAHWFVGYRPFLNALVKKLEASPDLVHTPKIQVFMDACLEATSEGSSEATCLSLLKEADVLRLFWKADFDRGIRLIWRDRSVEDKPADLTWERVQDRLLADNAVGLKKAAAMQGGGELFGVDEDGKLLFKDRGNEPMMFGFDQAGKIIMVYDFDENQMAVFSEGQGGRFANYYEIYKEVYESGYELFPSTPGCKQNGMIAAVEEVTKAPFVRSANGTEMRSSWLDNGSNPPIDAGVRELVFDPLVHTTHQTFVREDAPLEIDYRGAIRLLRV